MQSVKVDQFHIPTSADHFTYLLRDDTVSVIAGFEKRGQDVGVHITNAMRSDLHEAYQTFVTGLVDAYKSHSGDRPTEVVLVDAEYANVHRNKKISDYIKGREDDYCIVTMDPLCDFPDIMSFAVSRLFEPTGMQSDRLTNRPGSPEINDQIRAIQKAAHGRKIILVEDDLFSGGTIKRTIELLHGSGVNGSYNPVDVEALFPGIQALSDKPVATGVPLHIDPVFTVDIPLGYETEDVLDIGDPRDFLIGGDGLVTTEGRMPYVLPFVSPSARATVPNDREGAFSSHVLELTKAFYEKAESITRSNWPAAICEPAAQSGLVYHGFTRAEDLMAHSMTAVLDHVIGRHSRTQPLADSGALGIS